MEISLIKKNEGLTWPELIVGDKQGEFIRDAPQCAAIAERLMHLTSEELVSNCNSTFSKDLEVCYVRIRLYFSNVTHRLSIADWCLNMVLKIFIFIPYAM